MNTSLVQVQNFPKADLPIHASVIVGNTLYVGGEFNNIGGVARRGLAAIDMTTYAVLPWDPQMGSGVVAAMVYTNGSVFVGGSFSTMNGGTAVSNLCPLNPVTGLLPSWTVLAIDGQVSGMTTDGSGLVFFTGQFTHVGATARNFAAALSFTGTLDAWDPSPDGPGNCIYYRAGGGGTIYLGGSFTHVNSNAVPITRNFAAKLGAVGNGVGVWDPSLNSPVWCMYLGPTSVLMGGPFTAANTGGTPVAVNFITSVDDNFGLVVPGFLLNSVSPVQTINELNSQLYITNFGGPLYNTAPDAFYTGNWGAVRTDLQGNIDPQFRFDVGNAPVLTTAVSGGGVTGLTPKIFFGGEFSIQYGLTPAVGIAILSERGDVLSTAIKFYAESVGPTCACVDAVRRIAYLGGAFNNITGPNGTFVRSGLAAFNLDTKAILPWSPQIQTSLGGALGIAVDPGTGDVYVIGELTTAGPASGPSVSRGNGAAFDMAGNLLAWDPKLSSGDGLAVLVDAENVYVGGSFQAVNGGGWVGLARFDKTTGTLDASWAPSLVGGNSIQGLGMNEAGTAIYVAGTFTNIGGVLRSNLARLDLVTGADAGFAVTVDANASSVFERAGQVYASGYFTHANGQPRQGVAVWSLPGVLSAVSDPVILGAPIHKGVDYWQIGTGQTSPWQTFVARDFSNNPSPVDPGFNANPSAFAGDKTTGVIVLGGFNRVGSVNKPYDTLFVGLSPTIPSTPMKPKIRFCLRRAGLTLLKWDPVFQDVNFNYMAPDSYNVYRSTNTNLETYELVASVTARDVTNNVDTLFTESLLGFYAYRVTAVVNGQESAAAQSQAVDSTVGLGLL